MLKMSHGFSKPQSRFIRDMVYGIQATGDTILTDIARCVDSENRHRNVENRLGRNLQAEGLAQDLQDAVMGDAKRFIDRNTLIIVDPTDVCKPHAYKMEHLTLVRDASRSTKDNVVTTRGYHGCMAVACRSGSRKTVPLALKLWSSNAAGHRGDEELRLVVVRGFGRKPMTLLTNLAVNERLQKEGRDGTDRSYRALWQVVEGYLSRWRIEETIRFVKQCYGFENIRVMSYASWRNMSALVLVTAYFAAAWLGRGVRKDVLVAHIERMHQRFNDVPEFFLYALADGIRRAFSRYGSWMSKAVTRQKPPGGAQPDLPGWDELAFIGAG